MFNQGYSHLEDDKFSLMQCPKNELEQNEMESIPYAYIVEN